MKSFRNFLVDDNSILQAISDRSDRVLQSNTWWVSLAKKLTHTSYLQQQRAIAQAVHVQSIQHVYGHSRSRGQGMHISMPHWKTQAWQKRHEWDVRDRMSEPPIWPTGVIITAGWGTTWVCGAGRLVKTTEAIMDHNIRDYEGLYNVSDEGEEYTDSVVRVLDKYVTKWWA